MESTRAVLLRTWVLPSLDLVGRFYLGWVFIYAAWGKIVDPYSFAMAIATYDMLPLDMINLMAIALPWLELITGVLLVVGFQTRVMALLVGGMMVMFLVAIVSALARGLSLESCGCFAREAEEAAKDFSIATVWRDVGWLAIAMFIYLAEASRFSLDRFVSSCRRKRAENRSPELAGKE